MYPREQLTLLEQRKVLLQARIHLQRHELAVHLRGVTRPIVWADRFRTKWSGVITLLPLLAGPLLVGLQRLLLRRTAVGGRLLPWLPMAWRAWKWLQPFFSRRRPVTPRV